jgi:glycosyltransferase involved in cell wall biosynthesis
LKLVMTLLVRNEEELVAANLDHHLAQGVDLVIVTDNGSTDATRALLAPHEKRGVAHVIDDPTEAHVQARNSTLVRATGPLRRLFYRLR